MDRCRLIAICGLLLTCPAHGFEIDHQAVAKARAEFVADMVADHGFDEAELGQALGEAEIKERILELISRPAERVLAWHEYRDLFLNEKRIREGVAFWQDNADLLADISTRYQVAPRMLVAIVGIETYYGRLTGGYRVLDALSTLAFAYPPRAKFFRSELEAFLLLSREEGVNLSEPLGSYAGAMGAPQFIPSSFRAYAVDASADGRRDIWNNWADVLGSVANYFKVHGWRDSEPVATRATLGSNWRGPEPRNTLQLNDTVASLSESGYVFATEQPENAPTMIMSLEGSDDQEYWVGYHNFRVITRYNRSVMYALAAHLLADEIQLRVDAAQLELAQQ
jgi:membrane-bound lytic murein transglycosylase B